MPAETGSDEHAGRPAFRSDCSQCCGLCCVAPAQLASQDFPADKPADTPCAQLDANDRCRIHANREQHGFAPCLGFDCYGAGQWVTQRQFGGRSWRESPDVAQAMFAAYRHWLPRFEAAALIETALGHVNDRYRVLLTALQTALTGATGPDPLAGRDVGRLRQDTLALVRALLDDTDEPESGPPAP